MKKGRYLLCALAVMLLAGCLAEPAATEPDRGGPAGEAADSAIPIDDVTPESEYVSFRGVVREVGDGSILVEPDEDCWERGSADRISLGLQKFGGLPAFRVGDVVTVFYDGYLLETYPAQISQESLQCVTLTEPVRMLRVDGVLYRDSLEPLDPIDRCGVMDGEIAKQAPRDTVPTEDGQSNFGKDFGYQIAGPDAIDILLDGEWQRFVATE